METAKLQYANTKENIKKKPILMGHSHFVILDIVETLKWWLDVINLTKFKKIGVKPERVQELIREIDAQQFNRNTLRSQFKAIRTILIKNR